MASTIQIITNKLSQWALPLFLTQKNKYQTFLLWALMVNGFYLIPNHFPIYEPVYLEFSFIDHWIPFIPNTFWVYTSEFIMYFTAYIMAKDMENTNKFLYAFMGLFIITAIIFMIWPTVFPRDLYPLTKDINPITYFAFTWLRIFDAPTSCVPSLHVASTYLTSFIFLGEQKKKFKYFFIWATLIGLSTMTTKQHYFVDVISGLCLSIFIYWVFFKLMPYRR